MTTQKQGKDLSLDMPLDMPKEPLSLVVRTGLALAVIILASVVGVISSAFIVESIDGDAEMINNAGSLRMLAYRVSNALLAPSDLFTSAERIERLHLAIAEFDRRLKDESLLVLAFHDRKATSEGLAYQALVNRWKTQLRPPLLDASMARSTQHPFLTYVDQYVVEIDQMVSLLEHASTQKIQMLRVIQLSSLFLTVIIVTVMLYKIQFNVVNPLKELVVNARQIQSGNFNRRFVYKGNDELGLLSDTFSVMSDSLSKLYGDLEQRVESKTIELTRSNQSLKLLYDSATKLNEAKGPLYHVFKEILVDLTRVVEIDDLSLCLVDENEEQVIIALKSGSHESHERGQREDLLANEYPNSAPSIDSQEDVGKNTVKFLLTKQNHQYGNLIVKLERDQVLANWQVQLLHAIVDTMATAISLNHQADQEAHLLLVEERTTIARELHDSLAQALSYQKFQLSRLQKLRASDADPRLLDDVVADIREGVNSAYRQLRELLTTFRLRLDEPGLARALNATINEFRSRYDIDFQVDCRLRYEEFGANEEIHCLQIVREALTNVIKHARATKVELKCYRLADESILISIGDNGIGLPTVREKMNHYGLAIMKERAKSLRGTVQLNSSHLGGVEVELRFVPLHVVDDKIEGPLT